MAILLAVAGASALLVLAGSAYQHYGARKDAACLPPPGRLFETPGGRLHLNVLGQGSPVVLFESGMASTSLAWSLVQPEIAKNTCTASYDRFGLGWSDKVRDRRKIEQVVSDLHSLIEAAALPGPIIFVGHSYGGLIGRAYAARYPAAIAGLVLVDPVAASEWSPLDANHNKMLRRGIGVSRFCEVLTRLGVVRFLMNRWEAISRMFPKRNPDPNRTSESHGMTSLDRIVGEVKKLPSQIWPAVQSHWCQTKCFGGMARYLAALPGSAEDVQRANPANDGVREIPMTVLSAGNSSPVQRAEHQLLAANSRAGKIKIISDSGHWMHFDRPDVVVEAVHEMVAAYRTSQARVD